MREGKDLTLIAFGKLVGYNLKAAEILAEEGIDAEVGPSYRRTLTAMCISHMVNRTGMRLAAYGSCCGGRHSQGHRCSGGSLMLAGSCRRASSTSAMITLLPCAQVLNLRTLKPIDRDAIVKSVTKTHRCVVVEEGWPQSGVGAGVHNLAPACPF